MVRAIASLVMVGLGLTAGPVVAQPAVVERVVAVVNGEAVFYSELLDLEARRPDTPRPTVVEELIGRRLLAQLAERETAVSDLDVDRAIETVRRSSHLSESDFWAAVEAQGYDRASYRAELREELGVLRVVDNRLAPDLSFAKRHEAFVRVRRFLVRSLRSRARIELRL